MAILRFALEVLDVGYLVSDTTNDRDEYDEVRPDEPLGAFAPGSLDGALAYIRDEIVRHESEVARLVAEREANKAARSLGNVVAGPGFTAPPAPAAVITRPIKTDREIVDEVNDVALTILEQKGLRAAGINPRTYLHLDQQNPRIRTAWEHAVALYEQITGSEVSDALQAVLEEEKEEAITEEFPTSRPVA